MIKLKYVADERSRKLPFDRNMGLRYIGLEHISSKTGILTPDPDSNPTGLVSVFEADDVLFGKLRPYLAKIALAPFDGVCSTEALVLRVGPDYDARFLRYLLVSKPFLDEISLSTYGSRMPRTSWEFVGSRLVPRLDLPTQRRIADFLDRETARIDELIGRKEQLIELIGPKWEAIIHKARSQSRWIRLSYVAARQIRRVARKDSQLYVSLGLFNRGRGLFHKDPTAGAELGDSDFHWVQAGDLILSGQFAWEGAVALAGPDQANTIVSHRYPIYRGKEGVRTSYLFAYFRSEPGEFILNECSRGAAGRNRPLNTNILEKEKIPVPPECVQNEIESLVRLEAALKVNMAKSNHRLRELRSALITAAVTGQIDVDTWRRMGETERRIDVIEHEVAGA